MKAFQRRYASTFFVLHWTPFGKGVIIAKSNFSGSWAIVLGRRGFGNGDVSLGGGDVDFEAVGQVAGEDFGAAPVEGPSIVNGDERVRAGCDDGISEKVVSRRNGKKQGG